MSEARRFTRTVLAESDLVHTAELVISELATNAVEHTESGWDGGQYVVELEMRADHVHVGVIDMGGQGRPLARVADGDSLNLGGRGLRIVEAVAKSWGSEPVRVGLRVWAELVGDEK